MNSFWIASSFCRTFASWAGWLTSQSFCGARRMRAPLRPAALVAAAERRGRRPGRRDQFGDRKAGGEDLRLQRGDVLLADQRMIHGRDRVLPDQRLLRNERAEVAHDRTHVAVGQLEPRAGEGVGELVRMLVEAPRDLLVRRIEAAARGRSSASMGACASTGRAASGTCRRRRPSASTDRRRPGSSSAPIRSRTGCRRSCCSTSSASASR